MPFDRLIDPLTHDYVDDLAGGFVTTTTIATSLFTQFHIAINEWWGREQSGNDLHTLLQVGDIGEQLLQEAAKKLRAAIQPIVDQGRAADPKFELAKDQFGRLLIVSSILDVQSGERISIPIRVGV